ncbi:MAG: leucyl aminopeptidase family protein [Alphaproteobacteria bacterium]
MTATPILLRRAPAETTPIWPITEADAEAWLAAQDDATRAWLTATEFKPTAGAHRLLPGPDGAPRGVVLGLGDGNDMWAWGELPRALPAATYRVEGELAGEAATRAAVAWGLGGYRFTRYKAPEGELASLAMPAGADADLAEAMVAGTALTRDLVNTPAGDLGPAELAAAAQALAERHGADCNVISGDALLLNNFPMIHAVGRASSRAPRLIDLTWGDANAPKVTLVGKGVCFDSGGLDLKPAAGMLRMKKDMGGAATVLGLAAVIMARKLPVRLRVLVPAVENSVSGNAFRPGDVLATRKGLTVEIGNTDAEGRLVLGDALTLAAEEEPALLVDCATLTGAARVALGQDLPALFCDDDALVADIAEHGAAWQDPTWRMPLHAPYKERLNSPVADMNNVSEGAFGGSITAALFLQRFTEPAKSWAHIDLYAWNDKPRPGRPQGGEAMVLRALYGTIAARYG